MAGNWTKVMLLAGAAAGVLAVAACSSGSTTTAGSTTSATATASQPAWAAALGSAVTVVAPQTVAPGHGSPGAAVTGLIDAFNAGKFAQSCDYTEPSTQAECKSEATQIPSSDIPTIKDFGLGYAASDGAHAVVGLLGTLCDPENTPKCAANHDPAAIFSSATSFASLWKNAIKNSTGYSLTPCVEIGGQWYIYSS
jgi:hypothetical protein